MKCFYCNNTKQPSLSMYTTSLTVTAKNVDNLFHAHLEMNDPCYL